MEGRCGPATTSVGDAVARWSRWRSGLAAPRLPPQPRTRAQRQRKWEGGAWTLRGRGGRS